MRSFAFLIPAVDLSIEHQLYEFIASVADYRHIDLLCYNLILHFIMEIPHRSDIKSQTSCLDACLMINSQYALKQEKKAFKQNQFKLRYDASFVSLKQGYIQKKTMNTSWSVRYFVLTPTRLIYYSDDTQKQMKGCFALVSLALYQLKLKANYPQLNLSCTIQNQGQTQEKVYLVLNIEDQLQFQQWNKQIQAVIVRLKLINRSVLQLFPKLQPCILLDNNQKFGKSNFNFWNHLSISTFELCRYASHLDIIFFRSKASLSFIHRFFMRSYFDHVALLIKDQSQRIFVLEAVQSRGVCITSLQSILLNFHQQYEQLGYRKLLVQDRTQLQLQKLQDYINTVLGKKYELSLTKLLISPDQQQETSSNKQSEQQQEQASKKVQRTYFCSELIADIYLKFGILQSGKCHEYWPKDLQSQEVSLTSNYKLSPMMKVCINIAQDTSDNLSS